MACGSGTFGARAHVHRESRGSGTFRVRARVHVPVGWVGFECMQTKPRTYHPPEIPPATTPNPARLPASDMQRARADAATTLSHINFDRDVIVIWLPGTNRSGIPQTFAGPAQAAWGAHLSLVELMYPASMDIRQGVATGVATLRLVLQGIAARGKRVTVHLAGESQGAWTITETMSDPSMRAIVDRVALMSNPWGARHHFVDGHDPRIMEMSRRVDLVARRVRGNIDDTLDAAEAVLKFDLTGLPKLLIAAWHNPGTAAMLAVTGLRLLLPGGRDRDPHNYEDMMPAAVQFLRVGWTPPTAARSQRTRAKTTATQRP